MRSHRSALKLYRLSLLLLPLSLLLQPLSLLLLQLSLELPLPPPLFLVLPLLLLVLLLLLLVPLLPLVPPQSSLLEFSLDPSPRSSVERGKLMLMLRLRLILSSSSMVLLELWPLLLVLLPLFLQLLPPLLSGPLSVPQSPERSAIRSPSPHSVPLLSPSVSLSHHANLCHTVLLCLCPDVPQSPPATLCPSATPSLSAMM